MIRATICDYEPAMLDYLCEHISEEFKDGVLAIKFNPAPPENNFVFTNTSYGF